MRVRMLTSIAGNANPLYGLGEFSFAPGDTPDLHKDLAKAWIACGHAEKLRKDASTLAVDAETETAVTEESEGTV